MFDKCFLKFAVQAGALLVLGIAVSASSLAGTVTIKNCLDKPVKVKAFNSNDNALIVPFSDGCLKAKGSLSVKCATSSCKISVLDGTCAVFGKWRAWADPFPSGQYHYRWAPGKQVNWVFAGGACP